VRLQNENGRPRPPVETPATWGDDGVAGSSGYSM
jgi:hypothetical protein